MGNSYLLRLLRESMSWGLFGVCHGEAVTGLEEAALEAASSLECAMEKLLLAWRKLPLKLLPPPTHYSFEKCNPFPVRTLVEVGPTWPGLIRMRWPWL